MKLRILFAVISMTLPLTAQALETASPEDRYLCVVDKSSGFSYDSEVKEWTHTQFKTDAKYIISPSEGHDVTFNITQVGRNVAQGWCEKGFTKSGFLFCNTYGGEFRFNKINGRFLNVYSIGFYNVGPGMTQQLDQDSDTPFIQIGRCSRF